MLVRRFLRAMATIQRLALVVWAFTIVTIIGDRVFVAGALLTDDAHIINKDIIHPF